MPEKKYNHGDVVELPYVEFQNRLIDSLIENKTKEISSNGSIHYYVHSSIFKSHDRDIIAYSILKADNNDSIPTNFMIKASYPCIGIQGIGNMTIFVYGDRDNSKYILQQTKTKVSLYTTEHI